MEGLSQIFGFLYDIAELAIKPCRKVLKYCQKLASALECNGRSDICVLGLTFELKALCGENYSREFSKRCYSIHFSNHLEDSVPNIVIVLRILLTMPVTSSNSANYLF